jgi:hypothetical protein
MGSCIQEVINRLDEKKFYRGDYVVQVDSERALTNNQVFVKVWHRVKGHSIFPDMNYQPKVVVYPRLYGGEIIVKYRVGFIKRLATKIFNFSLPTIEERILIAVDDLIKCIEKDVSKISEDIAIVKNIKTTSS